MSRISLRTVPLNQRINRAFAKNFPSRHTNANKHELDERLRAASAPGRIGG